MLKKITIVLLLCLFALTACGQGGKPVPQLPATRPAELPAITPALTQPPLATPPPALTRPSTQATRQPGQILPTLPSGTIAVPKIGLTLTTLPLTPLPITLEAVTRVAEYDAAQAITTYASNVLGISVNVVRAGGARGKITLPPSAQRDVQAGASLAGSTYFGVLSDGAASVSLGQGAISGDLMLDVQSASLGAFSLLRQGAMPTDQNAALALVKQTYPGIANLDYVAIGTEQGFAFTATSSQQGLDWETRQATAIAQVVQVGVMPGGRDQVTVYAVVGKGTFAAQIGAP